MSVHVSLVISVYNHIMHTMQCLESIRRLQEPSNEVIVVDNASTDGTAEYLKEAGVQVISNATNVGRAKAWNQGIRASHGDVIGVVSQDVVVTPGWIPALMAFMEGSGCGIVSPAMREGPLDYELDRYAAEFTAACRDAVRPGLLRPSFFVTREVFDRVGLFDEEFTDGGCEDTDLLWRAQKAGIKVAVTGSAFVHHFGMMKQQAGQQKESIKCSAHNLEYFQKKWGRTVRGNWLQRRWTHFKESMVEGIERRKFGHTLVERGALWRKY